MRALEAQRVVVTRAVHQAEELARPLRELGADVILLPTIGIAPPADPAPLRAAAANCDQYDWILFTSANAVDAFTAELSQDPSFCKARVATVGDATREAAKRRGFAVSITPEKYVSEALVEALRSEDMNGLRVLIPIAAVSREVVATGLRERGAEVTVIEAYRNVLPADAEKQATLVFREPYPEWVTFTSSSAAENLIQIVGVAPLQHVKIATIGPITSEAVRHHRLHVTTEAAVHGVTGMVSAICLYESNLT